MRRLTPVLLLLCAFWAGAEAPSSGEAARLLSARGVANLTAFARLLALVRFFHPSDAAAAADWNRVAVAGIGAVEGATDSTMLSRALESFFRPLAPTLRVVATGKPEGPAE